MKDLYGSRVSLRSNQVSPDVDSNYDPELDVKKHKHKTIKPKKSATSSSEVVWLFR